MQVSEPELISDALTHKGITSESEKANICHGTERISALSVGAEHVGALGGVR